MKLFIFGSTGDLVKKKVLPALQELSREKPLEIIALGRRDFVDRDYHEFVCTECEKEFKKKLSYALVDFEKENICEKCERLADSKGMNYFYLSLPPSMLPRVIKYIALFARKGNKVKVLSEKPFGKDYKSAKKLKELLEKEGIAKDFFISDHYLFKDDILKLPKRTNSPGVKIISIESTGVEGRKYYDSVGALNDMVQSHFINLAVKAGLDLDGATVVKAVFGQYGDGSSEGYAKEVGKKSATETFVWASLRTRDGKKAEFITGKGFDRKSARMEINGERFSLEDQKNPYLELFRQFFNGKTGNFPSMEQSIQAWKLTEKIAKKKNGLIFYPWGKNFNALNDFFERNGHKKSS